MENKEIKKTKIVGLIVGSIFVGVLVTWSIVLFQQIDEISKSEPKKEYPVRVYYDKGPISYSYFDCDSVNLNYAWKDGVKIPLKDVNRIIFK